MWRKYYLRAVSQICHRIQINVEYKYYLSIQLYNTDFILQFIFTFIIQISYPEQGDSSFLRTDSELTIKSRRYAFTNKKYLVIFTLPPTCNVYQVGV